MGVIFLALGAFLLLFAGNGALQPANLISYAWPSMFLIPVGLLFHWMYFSLLGGKGAGLLIPGGIVLTVGVVCQIAVLTGGWSWLWPGFILAPAVGLFEFYLFGYRNKWLLLPIMILTVLSGIFFTVFSIGALFNQLFNRPVMAIVLIVAGVFLLLGWKKREV
jgi:hypothetical protein